MTRSQTRTMISYFASGEFSKVTGEVDLDDYFTYIQNGRWQDRVLAVRNGKSDKREVPSVTVSGLFQDRRRRENLSVHSGIIGIDLDAQDNPDLASIRFRLEQDSHCYACHTSVGGYGLVWYVKVSPDKHLEAFQAIERHLANEYGAVVDPSGKDVSRLRFISYDPDLYLNKSAKKWSKYLNKAQRAHQEAPRVVAYHSEDIAYILEQVSSRGANIAEDYHSWLHVSFALASEFGEDGRSYFHAVSAQSGKYEREKCDKQYDIALRRSEGGAGGVGIGTFFYYCQQAGIETRTPTTVEAEIYYAQRLKSEPGIDRKEAIKSTMEYMAMRGVDSERVEQTLTTIEDIPVHQFQTVQVNDKVLELETFVKSHPLAFNEVTRYMELDGKQMDDRDYYSIYRKAMHVIGFNLSKNKLFDVINSDLVRSYNPFQEFFKNNKHLRPSGLVKEVLACFDYKKPDLGPDATPVELATDFLDMFLHRWLIGIVSAMHGTHSILTLVLTGPQGCGKSKFFRNLLPDELKNYYAEGKMESDNDAKEMMTKKIIVMDDEFGGKNKTNAVRFKEISSKDRFYMKKPYGKVWEDLPRYAVLCGTSNEGQILNDPTGNRRLIPINVNAIDHNRFEAIDKVELFMELYWDWREMGNSWMLKQEDIAYLNKATFENEKPSFEEEMVNKYFEPVESEGGNAIFLTASEVKVKIDARTGNRIYEGKLGGILKKLGFIKKSVRRPGRKYPEWCYLMIDHGQDGTHPTTTQNTENHEVDF